MWLWGQSQKKRVWNITGCAVRARATILQQQDLAIWLLYQPIGITINEWMDLPTWVANGNLQIYVCLVLCVPVNSYGHVGMVNSANQIFHWQAWLCGSNQYFVHIHVLSLVTDNIPSWISRWEENGHRNYFRNNLEPRKYWTGPGSNPRPLELQ